MVERILFSVRLLMIMAYLCAVVGVEAGNAQIWYGNGKLPAMNNNGNAEAFTVDGTVALASLITIGDGHLVKIADEFKTLAARDEVIAGDWQKTKELLKNVADRNVPALMWFALPSGDYWTVEKDRAEANLKSRPYFSRLLAGKTVIGDLVVSKTSEKNVAVVAVPVLKDKKVVGMLGASVFLDKLSGQIKQEMALPSNIIFFSFDAQPLMAIDWDEGLIFRDPRELGEEVDRAFREMLAKEKGSVSYSFRGKTRDILFEKSPVTNWWYGLGVVKGETGTGR